QKKYSAAVCTLGCRVNQYESGCIVREFIDLGFEIKDFSDKNCDVYVINTCTVTAGSDKKSKQMIRRAKKNSPNAVIAVCGCFTQINPAVFKPDNSDISADIVLGSAEKTRIPALALEMLNNTKNRYYSIGDISEHKTYENIKTAVPEKTRAYIKIQDGCQNKCSYCIIPQVRGPEKSRGYNEIYTEAEELSRAGYREIVLTAIELSGYGRDLKDISLIGLLEKLDSEPNLNNIKSIRLSSVDPVLIKKDFIDRFVRLDKAANHLHLSLQSGSSRILNLMRRRYTAEQAVENINYAKQKIKDLNLTADIIAGFPGETDDDFNETLELIKLLKIYHAHIFTYSKRAGTAAADYPGQLPEHIKNMRGKILAQICAKTKEEIHSENINRSFDVIFEDFQNGYYTAKTKNFMDIKIKENNGELRGALRRVKTVSYDKYFLYGEEI
ncbi:MAG: tRNA (N(6)-L-threonylcarbamoyladenosine(37)-C(2))-methylthiotransferase MtaB, partial [Oscillospiraceae bacterium]|nr:tRNA (N(6)-L-threonylcarbamoyladenosine(37)-C(2))-methylthiotransferase MtaB [Oscillospiraceae bacterium]